MDTTKEQQAGSNSDEWDSGEWRKVRNRKLREWLLGDVHAVDSILTLSQISETWDDIVDGEPVTPDAVNAAFVAAVVTLGRNPFYQRNKAFLDGILMVGINAWLDSTELERKPDEASRMYAFFLRNYCYELTSAHAYLVGGWAHMRKVSHEMRLFFTHETYAQWEHRHV